MVQFLLLVTLELIAKEILNVQKVIPISDVTANLDLQILETRDVSVGTNGSSVQDYVVHQQDGNQRKEKR